MVLSFVVAVVGASLAVPTRRAQALEPLRVADEVSLQEPPHDAPPANFLASRATTATAKGWKASAGAVDRAMEIAAGGQHQYVAGQCASVDMYMAIAGDPTDLPASPQNVNHIWKYALHLPSRPFTSFLPSSSSLYFLPTPSSLHAPPFRWASS